MDWVYLVLVLAFIAWTFQIVFAYKRQAGRIDAMIEQAERTQAEVTEQAERHEAQAEELKTQLKQLEGRADELEGKEATLHGKITGRQDSDSSRSPTRHRAEGNAEGSND